MHHLYGQRQLALRGRGSRRSSGSAVEHRIKRVQSYLPQLNPIEYCFKPWKDAIKRVEPDGQHRQPEAMDAAPLAPD